MNNPLDSLVFLRLEEKPDILASFPDFDPSIPLPVRLPQEGDEAAKPDAAVSALTPEAILAGILALFAWDPENRDGDYYRNIVSQIRPNLREELTEAALIKIHNGDLDLAEEIFLSLKGMDKTDRITTLNIALLMDEKAKKCSAAGNREREEVCLREAEKYYQEAMDAEPPLPQAFFNAGYFFLRTYEYKKALEAFKTFAVLETGADETAVLRKEKAAAAVADIEAKNLDDALFKSAYESINRGEEERALEDIRLFLERHPKVWNAWFLLGWALRRLERWTDAKNAFTQALELQNPSRPSGGAADSADDSAEETEEAKEGFADICNELAICTMEEGSYTESRAWLVAALEAEPENTKIISNLGVLAWKTGDMKEAEGFMRTVLEINPDDQEALFLLRKIEST